MSSIVYPLILTLDKLGRPSKTMTFLIFQVTAVGNLISMKPPAGIVLLWLMDILIWAIRPEYLWDVYSIAKTNSLLLGTEYDGLAAYFAI